MYPSMPPKKVRFMILYIFLRFNSSETFDKFIFFVNKTSQTVQTTVSERHLEKDHKQDNYPNSIWQIYNDRLFLIGRLIWSHTPIFKYNALKCLKQKRQKQLGPLATVSASSFTTYKFGS